MREPQTPRELRDAFLKCFDEVDTAVIDAVDELVEKLTLSYCGEAELTKVEFLLGRTLFQMVMDGQETSGPDDHRHLQPAREDGLPELRDSVTTDSDMEVPHDTGELRVPGTLPLDGSTVWPDGVEGEHQEGPPDRGNVSTGVDSSRDTDGAGPHVDTVVA